jgi:hypothetical protein
MGLSFLQHMYYSVRYAEWLIGFKTRKTWPNKPYFALVSAYYDGNHWCLHIGPFYVGASYY